MSKLIQVVHRLRKDMSSDWSDELLKFNIEYDISPIYDSGLPVKTKNILFAYIILAYDNESEWMEVHKDRYQTKLKILKRIGADVEDQFFIDVAQGKNNIVQKVVTWFTLYQRDYRWDDIRACFDYHSEMMLFAGVKNPDSISYESFDEDEEGIKQPVINTEDIDIEKQIANNIKKASCLKAGMEMRDIAQEKLKQIQRDYVNLDTALHKEGVVRITETVDITKWEPFIKSIRRSVVD